MKIVKDYLTHRPNLFDDNLTRIDKFILHDPGNNQSYSQVRRWLETTSRVGCYHDVIEGDTVYQLVPHDKRVFHAGTFEFSDHWPEIGTNGTQNRFSLGICGIRNTNCWETGAKYIAYLLKEYGLGFTNRVNTHYQLSTLKTDPIELQGNMFNLFLDEVAKYYTGFNK